MEAKQYVKIILALVFLPTLVFGYDNNVTHPFLTSQAIDLYELGGGKNFSSTEEQAIKAGSIEEDTGDRPLNHFFDPISGTGLYGFAPSKTWAHGQNPTGNIYSWENAIYDYVYGDKIKGLNTLGHIVHLIQDKTVPDHTRADNHYWHSTYESYSKTQTVVGSAQPIILSSLNEYFDQAANFSNNNFFSDDTILKGYQNPKIIKEIIETGSDGGQYVFGVGNFGKIVEIKKTFTKDGISKGYLLLDPDKKVMSAYWSTLAPKAVGYSAGVIKLFFAEVEKEQQTHALQKAREPWWKKLVDLTKSKVDKALAIVSLAKNTSNSPTAVAADAVPTNSKLSIGQNDGPGHLPTLDELEAQLKNLRAELEALTEANKEQTLKIVSSTNQALALVGVDPVVETAVATNTTATTTATTTKETLDQPLVTNFSIDTCSFSLASDFCLLVSTSSLSFSWSPTPAGDYSYELIKLTQNNDDWNLWDKLVVYSGFDHVTSISTNLGSNDFSDEVRWQLMVKSNSTGEVVASSSEVSTFFHPRPLVVNEIGWAGTVSSSLDEWIELHNYLPNRGYQLNDFYLTDIDGTWKIDLSGQIDSGGYYLIERGSNEIFSNRTANLLTNWGPDLSIKNFNLNRLGLKLYQKRAGGDVVIDETPVWDQTNSVPGSLERNFENWTSTNLSTWENNPDCDYGNNNCALDRNATTTFGTPGIINRASIPRLI